MERREEKRFDPFDPRAWVGAVGKVASEMGVLAADATAWWLDPSSWTNVSDLWKMGDRLVAQLIEGVARRFTGERVEVRHDGRPVHLTLASVDAREPESRERGADVTFSLRDVAWEDHKLGLVDGVARGARMRPGLPAVVMVDRVDLTVSAPAEVLLASLGPSVESGWSLALLPDGRATIRHRRSGKVSAEVDPTVVDGAVRAQLRAIHIGRRRFATPKWLNVVRALPPPELPGGARLLSLAYADGVIRIDVAVPGFTREVDLKPLRRALTGIDVGLPIPV